MKDWKTSVGGILGAIGLSLQASDDTTVKSIGTVLIGIGGLMLGFFAKDKSNQQ